MKILVLLFLALLISEAVAEDELPDQYLCVADMATGFIYKDGAWRPTTFNVRDSKYILRRAKKSDNFARGKEWVFGEFGNKHLDGCDKSFMFFNCRAALTHFKMNLDTLRFQSSYFGGFLNGDLAGDTPYIEIGKCSPL